MTNILIPNFLKCWSFLNRFEKNALFVSKSSPTKQKFKIWFHSILFFARSCGISPCHEREWNLLVTIITQHIRSTPITAVLNHKVYESIITVRTSSCGTVMFSQACVCSRVDRGWVCLVPGPEGGDWWVYAWSQANSGEWACLVPGPFWAWLGKSRD